MLTSSVLNILFASALLHNIIILLLHSQTQNSSGLWRSQFLFLAENVKGTLARARQFLPVCAEIMKMGCDYLPLYAPSSPHPPHSHPHPHPLWEELA